MISGLALALAHLALSLVAIAAAGISAHRARHGRRVGRSGMRYRRLTTRAVIRRLDRLRPPQ